MNRPDPHAALPRAASPQPAAAPDRERWGLAAWDAWSVNVRCLAVITALLVGTLVVMPSLQSAGPGQLAMVWFAHLIIVVVIGYPLGVLTSRALPSQVSRIGATTAFAAVGGVAAGLLMMLARMGPGPQAAWFALGATTAGCARTWAHNAIRASRDVAAAPVEP